MRRAIVLLFILVTVLSNTAGAVEYELPASDYNFKEEENVLYPEVSNLEYLPEVSPLAAINNSYGVGTSNVAIFSGITRKLPLNVNYVYWRESQYAYCLAYGSNLKLDGSHFTADVVDVITYNTTSGYQEQASFTRSVDTGFTLSASNYLVYSNLGHYPSLDDGRDTVAQTIAISCIVAFSLFFVLRIINRFRR